MLHADQFGVYRENERYHETSSEGESDDIELLEPTASVIDVNDDSHKDELLETPNRVTIPTKKSRKEVRRALKRRSHEGRLAQFDSTRKKTPRFDCNDDGSYARFERLIGHHISELHFDEPAPLSNSGKDVNASIAVFHRNLPLERASEMFYARSICPPPPTSVVSHACPTILCRILCFLKARLKFLLNRLSFVAFVLCLFVAVPWFSV